MNVEQTLINELRAVTEFQAPPPPATAELVRLADRERARSRRTRFGGAALVAAAVVAAIVIGNQVGRPSAAPAPVKPSPSYYAPGVPYVYKGTLYVDHEPQGGHWYSAESHGDYTVALDSELYASILHNGEQIMQIGGPVYGLSLSPDGTKAAWITMPRPGKGVLVVRDLTDAQELGQLSLALRAKGDQGISTSLSVRDDGTTYYEVDGRWKWQAGAGTPVHVRSMPNDVPEHAAGFPGVGAPVRLSPDHLWGAWITDPEGRTHDDLEGVSLAVTVQKPGDSGSRFTMRLPAGADVIPIPFWDSPTQLYLQGSSPQMTLCDIVERRCRPLANP